MVLAIGFLIIRLYDMTFHSGKLYLVDLHVRIKSDGPCSNQLQYKTTLEPGIYESCCNEDKQSQSAKGKKDRYMVLSEKLKPVLAEYLDTYKPSYWLFEGQDHGQSSVRSVQQLFRNAVQVLGVNSYATVHTLRHSYATHQLENGTDLRYIYELFGHNSLKTTQMYTHYAKRGLEKIGSSLYIL
jgi:integrase